MISYLKFLKLLAPIADKLPVLLSLLTIVTSATASLQERWDAIKSIGDAILPIVDEIKTDGNFLAFAVEGSEEEILTAEAELLSLVLASDDPAALAWDGSWLRKLFEVVGPLLSVLIGLIK